MELIQELLIGYGIGKDVSAYLSTTMMIVLVILLCVVANFVTKKIVMRLITHVIKKTSSNGVMLFWSIRYFISFLILYRQLLFIILPQYFLITKFGLKDLLFST